MGNVAGITTTLGTTVRQNGGVVMGAGNIAATAKTHDISLRAAKYKTVYSSRANETNSRVGTATRPLNGGDYAKMTKGRFICVYLTGGYIAGVANTVLNKGACTTGKRSLHKLQKSRKYANVSWNAVTGALTKGGTAGNAFNFINPAVAGGTTASSESGSPTNEWLVNGNLYFMAGAKTAATVAYSVRKG